MPSTIVGDIAHRLRLTGSVLQAIRNAVASFVRQAPAHVLQAYLRDNYADRALGPQLWLYWAHWETATWVWPGKEPTHQRGLRLAAFRAICRELWQEIERELAQIEDKYRPPSEEELEDEFWDELRWYTARYGWDEDDRPDWNPREACRRFVDRNLAEAWPDEYGYLNQWKRDADYAQDLGFDPDYDPWLEDDAA